LDARRVPQFSGSEGQSTCDRPSAPGDTCGFDDMDLNCRHKSGGFSTV
jgi:hypothetical protein